MAAARIMLVALLAMFAVQNMNAASTGVSDIDDLVKKALEAAKKLLHALSEQIEALDEKAEAELAKLKALIEDLEAKLEKDVEADLAKIKEAVEAEVKKMEDIAKQHGVDIVDCVNTEEAATSKVIDGIVSGIDGCVAPEQQEAEELLAKAKAEAEKVKKELTDGEAALEACLSLEPKAAIKCIEDGAKTTIAQLASDVKTIAEIVAGITKVASEAESKIPLCVATKIISGDVQEAGILKDFAACVAAKVPSTTAAPTTAAPTTAAPTTAAPTTTAA